MWSARSLRLPSFVYLTCWPNCVCSVHLPSSSVIISALLHLCSAFKSIQINFICLLLHSLQHPFFLLFSFCFFTEIPFSFAWREFIITYWWTFTMTALKSLADPSDIWIIFLLVIIVTQHVLLLAIGPSFVIAIALALYTWCHETQFYLILFSVKRNQAVHFKRHDGELEESLYSASSRGHCH
jgi:hypothetical protein